MALNGDAHGAEAEGFRASDGERTGSANLNPSVNPGAKHFDNSYFAGKGLQNAENGALDNIGKNKTGGLEGNSILGQKEKEEAAAAVPGTDGFINKVTGKKKDKKKGKLRATGPLGAIGLALASLGAIAAFSGIGQMFLPISLISQFQGNFDSIGVSNFFRTKQTTKWQLFSRSRKVSDGANEFVKKHSKIYQLATGNENDTYFKFSKKQRRKLENQGVHLTKGQGFGAGYESMWFEDVKTGKKITVTPDEFNKFYDTNADFHNRIHEGTKTWRKSLGEWFDKVSTKFFKKISVFRNIFSGFGASEKGKKEDFESGVQKAIGSEATGGTSKTSFDRKDTTKTTTETDSNGKTMTKTETIPADLYQGKDELNPDPDGPKLDAKHGSKPEEVEAKVNKFTGSALEKYSGRIGKMATGLCAGVQGISALTMLATAMESAYIIKFAASIFEGIQKGQIDNSKESPINEIGNSLTKPKKTSYTLIDGSKQELNGSAMESASVKSLYGNYPINANDPSVQSFRLSDALIPGFAGLARGLGRSFSGQEVFSNCAIAKMGASLISAVNDAVDLVSIGACVAGALAAAPSFGASLGVTGVSCGKILGGVLFSFTMGIGLALLTDAVMNIVMPIIMPRILGFFTRDLTKDIGGEDYGNALASGANGYMGQNHQFGGGSPASKEALVTFLKHKEEYIADNAKQERYSKNPFDMSSPYTFMGSLMGRLIPLMGNSASAIGRINSFSKVVGSSLTGLLPHSAAMTAPIVAEEAAKNTEKNCPELHQIDAVGDVFCNPYFVSDMDTMTEDPAEITRAVGEKYSEGKNFTLKGDTDVPIINENLIESNLYKYLILCGQRQSSFGWADQNIADAINGETNTLIGMLPVVGDVNDILSNNNELRNIGLITGQACVAKNKGTKANMGEAAFTWDEASRYQRFIEDQRIAENQGLVEKSSVSVALENYYQKHPVDKSPLAVIAAKMGVRKTQAKEMLALMQDLRFMANYAPAKLLPYQNKTDVLKSIAKPLQKSSQHVKQFVFQGVALNTKEYRNTQKLSVATA